MLYIYTVDKKIQIDFFTQENIHASLNISNVRTPKGTPQKIQQGTPLSKKSSSVPASIDNIENNDHYHHQVISWKLLINFKLSKKMDLPDQSQANVLTNVSFFF